MKPLDSLENRAKNNCVSPSHSQRKTHRSRGTWRISARKIFFALASVASFVVLCSVLRLHYMQPVARKGYVLYKDDLEPVSTAAAPAKDTWCNPLAVVLRWLHRVGTAVGTDNETVNATDTSEIGTQPCVDENYPVTSDCQPAPSPELLRRVNDMLSAGGRKAASRSPGGRRRKISRIPEISLVLLTKSAPANKMKRDQVRTGWLLQARERGLCDCRAEKACRLCRSTDPTNGTTYTWLHHFVVGAMRLKRSLWQALTDEHLDYSDLLFYPGVDAYTRLTWKVLWTMEWMLRHYYFRYLLLLDDDCFVQMPLVISYIHSAPRERVYAGRIAYAKPKVQRDRTSKWFVNSSIYDHQFYPPYPWGAGLFLSQDVVAKTLDLAKLWRRERDWFGIDDAFMGILLNDSGIQATDIRTIHPDMWQFKKCNQRNPKVQPMIVVAIDRLHMNKLVDLAKRNQSLCSVLVRPPMRRKRRHARFVTVVAINLAVALLVVIAVIVIVAIKSDEPERPHPERGDGTVQRKRVLRTRVSNHGRGRPLQM